MGKYTYKIGLPALGAKDVAKREMYVILNGMETIHEIDITLTEIEMTFEQDSHCVIYIVDIDDAENRSANGEKLEFTVLDVVPPKAPSAPVINDVVEYQEPVLEETPEEPVLEETPEEPVLEETPEEPVLEETPEEPPTK